ncbi:hypothetical protein C8F01DRAFT_1169926 [Mycena amicta]|nr:hypothetical protein C8F01DRAFT_1169926 [Mycena amicta]
MKHMLRLDVDGFNYEEILSSELAGPSGAAYRRSIVQDKLTARRNSRSHPYRRTSSTAGRANADSARLGRCSEHHHSPRRATSDSEKHSDSDSAPETVFLRDIAFTEELGSGTTFFMHSAKHKGRPITVKVFNATANPRQLVEREIQLAKEMIHPNLLRLEGASAPASPTQFITYQSAITADRRLGTALDANLETSVALAFQMVGELAAGLNYLHLQGIPMQCIQITHFNVLFASDQRFLIALDPAVLDHAPLPSSPVGIDVLWRYFNELCELVYPDVVDLSSPTGDATGPVSLIFPDGSRGVKKKPLAVEPNSSAISPRREFVWRKLSRGDQTLTMVSRRLGSTFTRLATSLNRLQIRSTSRKTFHRCAGYLREEITLATRSRNSAILTYDSPSPLEICKVCHQEVRLEVFECICGNSGRRIWIRRCGLYSHRALPLMQAVDGTTPRRLGRADILSEHWGSPWRCHRTSAAPATANATANDFLLWSWTAVGYKLDAHNVAHGWCGRQS